VKSYEKILDYNKLEEVVIVSNTASYLYSNFQRNQSILDLSTLFTDQELIGFFYKELNEKDGFRRLVNLYAIIVALSFIDSSYSFSFFSNLRKLPTLNWASELAEIYFSRASYTNIEEVTISPRLVLDNDGQEKETTEFENLEFV
jgi:hypothetical protein